VFQSRISLGLASALCAAADEAVDDAQRTVCEVGLNVTLRFGRGTRRRVVVDEESLDRRVLEELVWYVGVKSVGCILQPIAAVLRLGAVDSIFAGVGS
jgi:hypothetical protein